MAESAFERVDVQSTFDALESPVRKRLLELRALIKTEAENLPQIGGLDETLKWGEPAYLPKNHCVGTTIRIGPSKIKDFALFVHCQTTLINEFRHMFPDEFHYETNRGIHFDAEEPLDTERLRLFISNALTYHLRKKT